MFLVFTAQVLRNVDESLLSGNARLILGYSPFTIAKPRSFPALKNTHKTAQLMLRFRYLLYVYKGFRQISRMSAARLLSARREHARLSVIKRL